jgi:penicillin amidase
MSIPGVPFVVAGRNRHIAWGITNAMIDDEDFYVEEVDSVQHPTKYRFNDTWQPVTETVDTIYVKDNAVIFFSIFRTHRCPIVNKMEPGAAFAGSLISMQWTGYEVSNEAGTFYRINRAKNWNEFTEALQSYAVPAQNFVYGDDEGTIGYYTGGKLPIRGARGASLPLDGKKGENDWKGFVPFQQMPHCINPKQGFIATANNKIVDESYPFAISGHWEPPWRAMRLNEELGEQPRFSVRDFEKLQCDVLSLQARETVPIILHAFDSVAVDNANVKTALEYLRNWNDEARKENVAATIFQAAMDRIIYNTFADEMGDQLFALYDTLASTPLTVITKFLKEPNSAWFDDIRTPEVETKDVIIRKSLTEALAGLRSRLGGEPKEWQWGKVHTVTFGHVFGSHSLLGDFFNVGPFGIGGTHATVNVGQYFLSQPFESRIGPSMRQIMNLADVNDTRVVLPPGQSGNVFYGHYKDQVKLWLNGAYRNRPMEKEKIEASCSDVLRLRPAQ